MTSNEKRFDGSIAKIFSKKEKTKTVLKILRNFSSNTLIKTNIVFNELWAAFFRGVKTRFSLSFKAIIDVQGIFYNKGLRWENSRLTIHWQSKNTIVQSNIIVTDSYPTNTPHVLHVETTWKRQFLLRFNVEYMWCVCGVVHPSDAVSRIPCTKVYFSSLLSLWTCHYCKWTPTWLACFKIN